MHPGSTTDTAARPRLIVPGFLALGAIWGSSFLFIKVGVETLHPVYVTLARVSLGATTMLLVMLALRERLPRDPKVWAHLAVVGAIGVAVPFTLFGYAEQRIPSFLAGIWNATTPLVTLPLATLLFRTERLTVRKTAGVLVGFAGVLVVLGVWQGVGGSTLTGQLLCFGAACCYAIAIPYLKRFVAHAPLSNVTLVAGQMTTSTVLLAVVAPFVAGAPPPPTSLGWEVVASLTALGALGTGLAFLIHYRNIRLVGASAASLVTYLVPLFAVLAGVLVLSEHVAWHQPVGAAVVLAGVAISQGLPRRRPAPPTPPTAATDPATEPATAPGPAAAPAVSHVPRR